MLESMAGGASKSGTLARGGVGRVDSELLAWAVLQVGGVVAAAEVHHARAEQDLGQTCGRVSGKQCLGVHGKECLGVEPPAGGGGE